MNLDTGADPPFPMASHSHKINPHMLFTGGMFMMFPMLVQHDTLLIIAY